MSWPPRDKNGWLVPLAPVTPESVEHGFSVLGNGIGCILFIIQIVFVISLPVYAVIYAGKGNIIPVIVTPLVLIAVAFLFSKAIKLHRAIFTGSVFVTLLIVFITTILVVSSYVGYVTQAAPSQSAPAVATVPAGTVSENVSFTCSDPSCIVGIELDHIVLDADQQNMVLTFNVTSSQDCENMFFSNIALQSSDGSNIQPDSEQIQGQDHLVGWGNNWNAVSGQTTTVDMVFNFYPTPGSSYQLLVETSGSCYNLGDGDHFQPQTIAF